MLGSIYHTQAEQESTATLSRLRRAVSSQPRPCSTQRLAEWSSEIRSSNRADDRGPDARRIGKANRL